MRTKPACLPSRSTRAIRVILAGFGQLLAGVKISTRRNLRAGRFEERSSVISRATTVAGVGRGDIEQMRSAGSAGEQSFRVGRAEIGRAACRQKRRGRWAEGEYKCKV